MSDPDYLKEYLALRAANDELREQGKKWLFDAMATLCATANRNFGQQPDQPMIQTGYQPREFQTGNSTMIGEAMGLRYRMNTLLIEAGWPREPKHGHVPGQGLARGQIRLSRNPGIDANLIAELILKADDKRNADWYLISGLRLAGKISRDQLSAWFELLFTE